MVEPLQDLNPNLLQRQLMLILKNEFKYPYLPGFKCFTWESHKLNISPNRKYLLYCQSYFCEGDTNKDFCHYFLFKQLKNKLIFIEKFSHIVKTSNYNDNYLEILDGSRIEWKNQENSAILDFIHLELTIHADEIEKNKPLLEGKFKLEGDVYPKEFQIMNFLGDFNMCPNRHNLAWHYRKMSFDKHLACENCLEPEKESNKSWFCFGWYCVDCWYFICNECKKIPSPENKFCPEKHKLNWTTSKQKPPPPNYPSHYPKNLPEKSKKIYEAEYLKNLKNKKIQPITPRPYFECEVCLLSSKYEEGRWECDVCAWRLCSNCRSSDD